jgi:hypothetical protein
MVQHRARQRKETPLDMLVLQPSANPCNAGITTRNEMSGSSPLVGSIIALDKPNTQNLRSVLTYLAGLLTPLSVPITSWRSSRCSSP